MFETPMPDPFDQVGFTILAELNKSYSNYRKASPHVEPNVILLSGFHMTHVVKTLERNGVLKANSVRGNVVKPAILGLPVIVADVTPSVGYMAGDNRFLLRARSLAQSAELQYLTGKALDQQQDLLENTK